MVKAMKNLNVTKKAGANYNSSQQQSTDTVQVLLSITNPLIIILLSVYIWFPMMFSEEL